MNPESESRFLRSFLTVVASLVLVCGSLVLLTSTAPWTPRQEAADGAPTAPRSARGASESETQAELAIAPSESESDDQTLPSEAAGEAGSGAEIQVAEAGSGAPEPVQYAASESSSSQSEEEAVDASVAPQVVEPEAVESEAIVTESMMGGEPGTGADAAPAYAPETDVVPETEAADSGAPPTPVAIETAAAAEQESAPATPVAVETTEAADPNSVEPATPVGAETTEAADRSGELLAESPAPAAIATETIGEDADEAADPPTAAPAQSVKNTSEAVEAAKPKVAAALPLPPPPPPLPKRKPRVEPSVSTEAVSTEAARSAPQAERPSRPDAPKQAKAAPTVAQQAPKQAHAAPFVAQEAPKQTQAAPLVAQQAPAQPGGGARRWFPMALAPADKPVATQPKARLSGAAYASKVWGALARHKPRAGQSGSATVVFSIGPSGALGGVRIGKSSGNTNIDQLALATVRGAAPFPPPPSGPASFSIRIDF